MHHNSLTRVIVCQLVLQGFPLDTPQGKLMTTVFQNMFPAINVSQVWNAQRKIRHSQYRCTSDLNRSQVDVKGIKRVVILKYDASTDLVQFRHYEILTKDVHECTHLPISLAQVGVSKGVKQLLKTSVPDLSQFKDISDFVLKLVPPARTVRAYAPQRRRVRERRRGARRRHSGTDV